jgi:hypothetical protein
MRMHDAWRGWSLDMGYMKRRTRAQVSLQGSTAWATRGGGAGDARGNGVAADAEGAALVVGTFQGRATFGAEMLDASSSDSDAFVLKVCQLTSLLPCPPLAAIAAYMSIVA